MIVLTDNFTPEDLNRSECRKRLAQNVQPLPWGDSRKTHHTETYCAISWCTVTQRIIQQTTTRVLQRQWLVPQNIKAPSARPVTTENCHPCPSPSHRSTIFFRLSPLFNVCRSRQPLFLVHRGVSTAGAYLAADTLSQHFGCAIRGKQTVMFAEIWNRFDFALIPVSSRCSTPSNTADVSASGRK